MNSKPIWFAVLLTAFSCGELLADTFGNGADTFDIEFVTIGNPGNPADTTGTPNPAGAVPYVYRMGKYEVSEDMIAKANTLGGLGIIFYNRDANKPATSISWFEAANFVNWLNTSTGHNIAYKFARQPGDAGYDPRFPNELWTPGDPGYNPNNLFRNSLAKYFLPSDDEWYKAAYYDPNAGVYYDFPTGSDSVPDGIDFAGDTAFDAVFQDSRYFPTPTQPNDITDVGVLSPYGTAGQGGNVEEWEETARYVVNRNTYDDRRVRGGIYFDTPYHLSSNFLGILPPLVEGNSLGFRIAAAAPIPEPTCTALFPIAAVMLGTGRLRTRRGSLS